MNRISKGLQAARKKRDCNEIQMNTLALLRSIHEEIQKSLSGPSSASIPTKVQKAVKIHLTLILDVVKDYPCSKDAFTSITDLINCVFDVDCGENLRLLVWEIFCFSVGSSDEYMLSESVVGKVCSFCADRDHLDAVDRACDRLDSNNVAIWAKLFASAILPFYVSYPLARPFNWRPKTKVLPMSLADPLIHVFAKLIACDPPFDFLNTEQNDVIFATISMLYSMGYMKTQSNGTGTLKRFVDNHFHFDVVNRSDAAIPESLSLVNMKLIMSVEEKDKVTRILKFLSGISSDWSAKLVVEVLRLALMGDEHLKYTLLFRKLAKILHEIDNEAMTTILCTMLSLMSTQTAVPLSLAFLVLIFDYKTLDPSALAVFTGTRSGSEHFDVIVKQFIRQLVFVFAEFYIDASCPFFAGLRENPVQFEQTHHSLFGSIATERVVPNCHYYYLSSKNWTAEQVDAFMFQFASFAEMTKDLSYFLAFSEPLVSLHRFLDLLPKEFLVQTCEKLLVRIVDLAMVTRSSWSVRLIRAIDDLMGITGSDSCVGNVSKLLLTIIRCNQVSCETIASVLDVIASHVSLFALRKLFVKEMKQKSNVWKVPNVLPFLISSCLLEDAPVSENLRKSLEDELKEAEHVVPEEILLSLLGRFNASTVEGSRLVLALTMLTLNNALINNASSQAILNCWGVFLDSIIEFVPYQALSLLRILTKESAKLREDKELLSTIVSRILKMNRSNVDVLHIKTRVLIVWDAVSCCRDYFPLLLELCQSLKGVDNPELQGWMQKLTLKAILTFGTPVKESWLHSRHMAMTVNHCNYFVEIVNDEELLLESEQFGKIFDCRIRQIRDNPEAVEPLVASEVSPVSPVLETSIEDVLAQTNVTRATCEDFQFQQCPKAPEVRKNCVVNYTPPVIDSFISVVHVLSRNVKVNDPHLIRPGVMEKWTRVSSIVFGDEGRFSDVEHVLALNWCVRSDRISVDALDEFSEPVLIVWNGTSREMLSHCKLSTAPAIIISPVSGNGDRRLFWVRCVNPSLSFLTGIYLACLETISNVIGCYVYNLTKYDYE